MVHNSAVSNGCRASTKNCKCGLESRKKSKIVGGEQINPVKKQRMILNKQLTLFRSTNIHGW